MSALEGYIPSDIIKTLNAFLNFCYIARQNVLTEDSLNALNIALERFHHYREIFQVSGVRPDGFSLPCQHSLKHYCRHIENFGAPNGLCSSITESKYITAVKKPWCRSGRYEALKQMLTINTRNDKLAAVQVDFSSCGMLQGTCLGKALRLQHRDPDSDVGDDYDNEFSGPDGNGESGNDLDVDHEDNEDDRSPGLVDGPPILSKVVLAEKKGLSATLFYSESLLILWPQLHGTHAPHSKCSGHTLVRQTSMILSDTFSSTSSTQSSSELLPFISVQLQKMSRTSLFSTQQLLSSAHQVTFL